MPSRQGNSHRVAIVGASSLRGKELKQVLEDRHFPASDILLLDESVAAGTLTEAGGEPTFIRALDEDSFEGIRFAFFAGSSGDAERNRVAAQSAGASVIDLTGALAGAGRKSASAVTRIPSLDSAAPTRPGGEVSGPAGRVAYYSPPAPVIIGCTLAIGLRTFQPLRISMLLFPPVSEREQAGIEELESQSASLLSFREIGQPVFGAQVAFNLLVGYGEECRPSLADMRSGVARDIAMYLDGRAPLPAIQLVQAPVFYGYAVAAYAELASPASAEQLAGAFAHLGVKTSAAGETAPTNVSVAGESEIHLARIERDPNVPSGVWLWGVADNLRLAATNAVRIAEELIGSSND
ncbi:MAG TPA: Asd/ArgC dimerization domain-containing protein [Candidatus Acidoferrales bacterium]|nr:Asd/ArgC dimerization domain-containing protein [Candidatus Acidoferrales bacterium]